MHNRSRHERTTGAAAVRTHQPRRPEHWRGLTAQEILDRHPPAKTSPMRVLEILIMLFNHQHTAKQKRCRSRRGRNARISCDASSVTFRRRPASRPCPIRGIWVGGMSRPW